MRRISSAILAIGIAGICHAQGANELELQRLKIQELELRKQILELEAKQPRHNLSQQQPAMPRSSNGQQTNSNSSNTQPVYSPGSGYIRGPRGGCYTYTKSGNKRYVDRSLCN